MKVSNQNLVKGVYPECALRRKIRWRLDDGETRKADNGPGISSKNSMLRLIFGAVGFLRVSFFLKLPSKYFPKQLSQKIGSDLRESFDLIFY